MMKEETFEDLYKKLNHKQKEAVDTIEGPVMVIAGPGTGKTQILSLRIANILKKTDTPPDAILALTFTESGVHSMRKRLVEMMGSHGYRVNIFTFHGFCNGIIKDYPEKFPRIISSNNVSSLDKVKLMETIIKSNNFNNIKPYGDPFYYVNSLLGAISEQKRENIDPAKFKKILEEEEKELRATPDLYHEKGAHKGKMKGKYSELFEHLEKNKELSEVYEKYEEALFKNKFYDYDDMIIETIKALESDNDLLLRLQEKYQYILVDEHQDTNNAQNRVLELLASFYDSPNLFIVGDEKQAIFRFQGASLNNFFYFKNLYKDAKIIMLEENYRSTQSILDSAHSLIEKTGASEFRKNLKAKAGHKEKKIELFPFSNQKYELIFIAKHIKEKIEKGARPEDIAVIYRENKDAFPIAESLEKTGVPFVIESDNNIFEDNEIRKLIFFIEAVSNYGEDEKLIKVLHLDFLEINEFAIYALMANAKKEKKTAYEIIKSEIKPKQIDEKDWAKILEFDKKLSSWSKMGRNKSLTDFFETLVTESGYIGYILKKENAHEKLEKIDSFFEEIKTVVRSHRDFSLSDLADYIKMVEEKRVQLKSGGHKQGLSRVHLMTAHRSKGLEFNSVYIYGLIDGHWGNNKHSTHFKLNKANLGADTLPDDQNNDERRLFYVALTRAKKEAILSYSKENVDGRLLTPSQFLAEMEDSLIEDQDTLLLEEEFKKDIAGIFIPTKETGIKINDKEFLNELFLSQGLSVTALNNYLNCPWNYFYNNLIRIPHAPNKHAMYGTVIHATLKDFFDKLKEGEDIGKENLVKLFKKYANGEPFDKSDFEEVLKKGREALSGYYDRYIGEWNRDVLNEFPIHGVLIDSVSENKVKLTGKIDKIEILDGDLNVNVVDFKTGGTKTRNQIEGNTKNADGNYKRQLVFYKILLNGYDDGRYKMTSGEIDFIEPDDRGKYHKEKFIVEEDEVKELEEIIKKTSEEILSLSFWNKKCGESDCEFCKLRDLL
ncbi:MAG: UvrD/REP helicase [Parcubacteria group bacterium GW2011_GWF2_38_76]|nr:MAG: UvrD/REP helicase [Parcubacteria group bacterium GW2011_GWF2_38_76]HBM45748.1 hypothetical protein [Patescibacteria group bacterium]